MPSFRDDHILIISPGSQTTLAQLGLPESFTPAKLRIPSRMYPGLEAGTWTPIKVRELQDGEDLALVLGVKVDKKGASGKVKKDVVVGNGAPKTTKSEEGSTANEIKDTGLVGQEERPVGAIATPTGSGTGPALTTEGAVSVATLAKEVPGPPVSEDTEIPDADEGDEDELEEGELEEGEEGEQEGEGDEEAHDVEEIALTDDEELAEGEEIIEDIIEMPETENVIYVEDEDDEEGAVWPMQKGQVVNWGAFFALLTYIHELINPTFHTPVLVVCPPEWNRLDKELVTQFVFEKLRVPGLCLLDASLAVCWAYGISTATVIDVGYEKTTITPILDFLVCEVERDTISIGGEDMTRHLSTILGGEGKGWGRDLAEQLKCSNICEILDGSKITIPGQGTQKISEIVKKGKKLGKEVHIEIGQEEEDDEGAPNVAVIVASGKTREYLEKKEREKQEAAKGNKNLPNWRRETNKFWVVEKRKPGEVFDMEMSDDWESTVYEEKQDESMSDAQAPPAPALEQPISTSSGQEPSSRPGSFSGQAPPLHLGISSGPTPSSRPGTSSGQGSSSHPGTSRPGTSSGPNPSSRPGTSSDAPHSRPATSSGPSAECESTYPPQSESDEARAKAEAKEKRKEERRSKVQETEPPFRHHECRREVEVGIERFQAAECGIIQTIADALYRIISRVDDISRRQELWDTLVVVGNGSKIKGFKEAILSHLAEKYKISPSSASIFTSELPSSASTPLPTGASTPVQSGNNITSQSSVNPLLVAATTNPLHQQQQHHSSHSLSPMNMRLAKQPDYFPEWKDVGFEEAAFLGAQAAAKVVFVVDQGQNRGFLSRVEYNEMGPSGIHSV